MNLSLKYQKLTSSGQRLTSAGCKNIEIRKFEFVAKEGEGNINIKH